MSPAGLSHVAAVQSAHVLLQRTPNMVWLLYVRFWKHVRAWLWWTLCAAGNRPAHGFGGRGLLLQSILILRPHPSIRACRKAVDLVGAGQL